MPGAFWQSGDVDWSRAGLMAIGFEGFVHFEDLPQRSVPRQPGVYVVLREAHDVPAFRDVNPAGWFKGKNPTVALRVLTGAWVPEADVVYIGKAGAGKDGRRGIRKRLDEFRRHGAGEAVGHWGGRFVWQLADSADLRVAWLPTGDGNAETLEARLIAQFVADFGARPLANRQRGSSRPSRGAT